MWHPYWCTIIVLRVQRASNASATSSPSTAASAAITVATTTTSSSSHVIAQDDAAASAAPSDAIITSSSTAINSSAAEAIAFHVLSFFQRGLRIRACTFHHVWYNWWRLRTLLLRLHFDYPSQTI